MDLHAVERPEVPQSLALGGGDLALSQLVPTLGQWGALDPLPTGERLIDKVIRFYTVIVK